MLFCYLSLCTQPVGDMSGEWMKDFRRTASEKIRSAPSSGFAGATESLTRSIKESFRAGTLHMFLTCHTDV